MWVVAAGSGTKRGKRMWGTTKLAEEVNTNYASEGSGNFKQ